MHAEVHRTHRVGWLRAAVLGANDGLVSTASLLIGVAASNASQNEVMIAGVAGLVAGAMSMAAGEYVSVSSQADTERADLERERRELRDSPDRELAELASYYTARGLDPELAQQVAVGLTEHDALGAHAREELGILESTTARPVQAAFTSAGTFAIGALLPLLAAALASGSAADRDHRRDGADLPGRAGRGRRSRRRGTARGGGVPSHVLGRAGDGRDRCDRCGVRRGRLTRRARTSPR